MMMQDPGEHRVGGGNSDEQSCQAVGKGKEKIETFAALWNSYCLGLWFVYLLKDYSGKCVCNLKYAS
jgi:hypothetical protein